MSLSIRSQDHYSTDYARFALARSPTVTSSTFFEEKILVRSNVVKIVITMTTTDSRMMKRTTNARVILFPSRSDFLEPRTFH